MEKNKEDENIDIRTATDKKASSDSVGRRGTFSKQQRVAQRDFS